MGGPVTPRAENSRLIVIRIEELLIVYYIYVLWNTMPRILGSTQAGYWCSCKSGENSIDPLNLSKLVLEV